MNINAAAVVVGFYPNESVLYSLLSSLSTQVLIIILINNGGSQSTYNITLKNNTNIHYCDLGENKGLGYALNIGFGIAVEMGLKYVATFDQDSAPPANIITNLIVAQEYLSKHKGNIAAVGPVFYDKRESRRKYFPFYREKNGRILEINANSNSDQYIEVDTLITSGMLVRTEVWKSGINYEEGLIVDATDTEWCFRARANGYKLYACSNVEMGHELSDATPVRFFGKSFFRYSPLRRYYYFRNCVFFCKKSFVSWPWRKRLIIGMVFRYFLFLFIDSRPLKTLIMMSRGVFDGLRSITGHYYR